MNLKQLMDIQVGDRVKVIKANYKCSLCHPCTIVGKIFTVMDIDMPTAFGDIELKDCYIPKDCLVKI